MENGRGMAAVVWTKCMQKKEHPDMMSGSERGGGHGNVDIVRNVA